LPRFLGYRDEAEATEHLLRALHHPLRRELLRRYVDATGPLNHRDLAHLLGEPLSIVSHHVRELESDLAIVLVKDGDLPGCAADLYEATWWVRLSPEIVAALGLNPDEQVPAERKRLRELIAGRREDTDFVSRLRRRLHEDREVLGRLTESND
jgi:DNA-binding transcriptional ArsR family regulator